MTDLSWVPNTATSWVATTADGRFSLKYAFNAFGSFRLIDLNVRVYCYDLAVNLYSPLCVQVGFFTFHSPNTNTIVDAGVGGNSRS